MSYKDTMESPLGLIGIYANDTSITGLYFIEEPLADAKTNEIIDKCKKELKEYFNKERREFSVPIEFEKGTDFQKKCWNQLLEIPWGETACYQEVAVKIGNPKAVRAVGGANHNNPISIIVP